MNNVRRTGFATFASGTCVICGCAPTDPYRRWVDGKIVEGCIAEAHKALTVNNSSQSSVDWHNRADAKKLRKASPLHNPIRR